MTNETSTSSVPTSENVQRDTAQKETAETNEKKQLTLTSVQRAAIVTVLWTLTVYVLFLLLALRTPYYNAEGSEYTLFYNPIALLVPAAVSGFIIAKTGHLRQVKYIMAVLIISLLPIAYTIYSLSGPIGKTYPLATCLDSNPSYTAIYDPGPSSATWATFGLVETETLHRKNVENC